MTMVQINWEFAPGVEGILWGESRCLYAYIDSRTQWIVYIGKCLTTTVEERLQASDKDETFRRIAAGGTEEKDIVVSVGRITLPEGRRMSRELLEDLESLLIFAEKPVGNIQSTQSRGAGRPGLRVSCNGDWPGASLYVDPGPTPQ